MKLCCEETRAGYLEVRLPIKTFGFINILQGTCWSSSAVRRWVLLLTPYQSHGQAASPCDIRKKGQPSLKNVTRRSP